MSIQIDVIKMLPNNLINIVECNLYTGDRCVKIYMSIYDYETLIRDKFFIQDGKEADSANVLNTTDSYFKKGGENE